MRCCDAENCFNEITAYFNSEVSGYPFIANIDNSAVMQGIISKMQADSNKQIIKISDYCKDDNLPNADKVIADMKTLDNAVVIGLSAYFMLRGEQQLKQCVSNLLQLPIMGNVVVLLFGCESILRNCVINDIRLDHRTAILESESFSLPKITLSTPDGANALPKSISGINRLLVKLEDMSYESISGNNNEIIVTTKYSPSIFKNSMIPVSAIGSAFDIVCINYPEIQASMDKCWGTEKQWIQLSDGLQKNRTLSYLIDSVLGCTVNLSSLIEDIFDDIKSEKAWYLWIAMKVLGTKENSYLSLAVKKSDSVKNLIELIYMELLEHERTENDFIKLYRERKHIIEKLPENSVLEQNYCDHVGKYERNAVYYLTDLSNKEKRLFLKYLSSYQYDENEIQSVTEYAFPELYTYLAKFEFTDRNTKIPSRDNSLLPALTKYFHEYKIQKVTNTIHPDFLNVINEYAIQRPYTKLLPRISIVNDIDKKGAQLHFFDALGVEYLAYILAKCKEYDLQPVIHVAHCELPSITSQNLDFKKYFQVIIDEEGNEKLPGTKELDELKHHSTIIDYTKCKEPVHLFMELSIIDTELRKIREMLLNDGFRKIIIIADHGASRLSVLNQTESELYKMENHGKHSGRCCPIPETDTLLPEMIYDNGYAILANYDRFHGGRLANVEVHGGATLEETVVPIIEITLKPEETEIYLVNKLVEFHNKETVSVIIYSNVIIQSPKLEIKSQNNDSFSCVCECSGSVDKKNYKFDISEMKRSGKYIATLYDGDTLLQQDMTFETKKAISKTKDFF